MDESVKQYVRIDKYGVLRVGDRRMSLDSVVYAFRQGHSAEAIVRAYPALTLEQVYGAIAYYLGHKQEVHAYLRGQDMVWRRERAKSEAVPSPLRDRIRAAIRERAGRTS